MKETPTQPLDPTSIAVLHEAGGRWSVIVADVTAKRPRISASRRFNSAELSAIAPWLDTQHVGEALVVVPASSVVCRTFTLPDASPNQLAQGLELQAEAHLNGIAPSHRVAMAVLPAAASESSRSGLVLAWPESSIVELPDLNRDVRYTADVAALAALLGTDRPDDPLVWVDRHNEAVALAMTNSNGATIRATREGSADKVALTKGVRRALAETALNAGHTPDFIEHISESAERLVSNLRQDDAALLMPASLKNTLADRLEGTGADNQWWSDYGIAVGALLARTGELNTLTRMIDAPPVETPSIIQHAVTKLSQPRTATMVVLAVLLALAISPLLFNGLRLLVLKVRYSDLDEQLAAVDKARNSLTMYQELDNQAWSMTKLLSDIASSTPLGIELEIIRLRQGSEFSVAGQASPHDGKSAPELVSLMERQLRDSGIFRDVIYTWKEPTANSQYQFDLRAKIAQPHRYYKYPIEQNFASWTHEARRSGDPPPADEKRERLASPSTTEPRDSSKAPTPDTGRTAPATGLVKGNTTATGPDLINPSRPTGETTIGETDDGASRTSTRLRPGIGGARRDDPGMAGVDNRDQSAGANNPDAMPEFLSKSTIGTLSRQETISRLSDVSKAKKRWKSDEEVMAKINDQWQMLMDHLKSLPSET